MRPTGVLIAEDEPMTRLGIAALLGRYPDEFKVLGEATTGEQAIQFANELQPDLIVMDIRMPGLNGLEATRQIVLDNPRIYTLILTFADEPDMLYLALSYGARGYILKGADQEEMLRAVRAVCDGQAVFSPAMAERLLNFFGNLRYQSDVMPPLTKRENEVLSLMVHTSESDDMVAEIADKLVIARHTVQNHISNILTKLQAVTRDEAVRQRLEWEKSQEASKRYPRQ